MDRKYQITPELYPRFKDKYVARRGPILLTIRHSAYPNNWIITVADEPILREIYRREYRLSKIGVARIIDPAEFIQLVHKQIKDMEPAFLLEPKYENGLLNFRIVRGYMPLQQE
jgi:hypothetical protein